MPENGYIKARIYTSRGELPIEGAVVTITQKGTGLPVLLGKRTTDRNGLTTSVTVAAPSRSLSESPSDEVPFALVNARVDHPKYYTVFISDAQIFSGETTMIETPLIPLSENEAYDNMAEIFEQTPQNL